MQSAIGRLGSGTRSGSTCPNLSGARVWPTQRPFRVFEFDFFVRQRESFGNAAGHCIQLAIRERAMIFERADPPSVVGLAHDLSPSQASDHRWLAPLADRVTP